MRLGSAPARLATAAARRSGPRCAPTVENVNAVASRGLRDVRRCHGGPRGDLLAGEQHGLFVGVRCAADVTQQRGEVDGGAFRRDQTEALGEAYSHHADPHRRFGRLPMPQIGNDRQRGQDVRQAQLRCARILNAGALPAHFTLYQKSHRDR